jgi:hypothetical protein
MHARHTKSACKNPMVMSPYNIKNGGGQSATGLKTVSSKDNSHNLQSNRSNRVLTLTASKVAKSPNLLGHATSGKVQ